MVEGFKYFGYFLKPNSYKFNDWLWMVKKYENIIGHWVYMMLYLGGRLSLIKVVLIRILFFWFSMAQIPKSILTLIKRSMFTFIWFGNNDGGKYHLANWEILSKTKKQGGWDIKTSIGSVWP